MQLYEVLQDRIYNLGESFVCIEAKGPDAERFLNGQLSNDLLTLSENQYQLQARLDRTGKLQAFFYLAKFKSSYLLIIPKFLEEKLKEDLQKFIIMDDVELESVKRDVWLHWSYFKGAFDRDDLVGEIAGAPCRIEFEKPVGENLIELSEDERRKYFILQGEPVWGITANENQLVTDTVVNFKGVSLSKGCFLGQETVSKIETRRGGAYLPVIIEGPDLKSLVGLTLKVEGKKAGQVLWCGELEGKSVWVASLLRDYRIEGRDYTFETESGNYEGRVKYIPYYSSLSSAELAESLFENAVKIFQQTDEETAIKEFEKILKVDPENEDSFEAMGVIFGRMEKFNEGIEFMEKVLAANPSSVMAHTNKSLFYMRLGEIEKAEEEKAEATVKSFSQFGKEAQAKKQKEELKKQEEEEINRRYGMFQQVLEIDPEDALANYGLADIYYYRNEAEKSIPLLEKVLEEDPKYSVGYLLLGKCLLKVGELEKAKEIFEKGISVASKLGDLMPANEMQAKLVTLN